MSVLRSWVARVSDCLERNLLKILVAALAVLVSAFVVVAYYCPELIRPKILEYLGVGMGGVLLAIGATIANRRAGAMEDSAKAQAKAATQQAVANKGAEDGRRQERLKNAIEHLGHESDSVRLGGAYELFHLARDTEELRQTVMDILCAHIRHTTGAAKYWKKHAAKPSGEVQSLLTLLFVQEHEIFKGCRIDLQGSQLNGADLFQARLQGARLFRIHLRRATLLRAHLQGSILSRAHLQGANLSEVHLQGATLSRAHLQGVTLSRTHLQGANLSKAHLQGAHLPQAHLQGANISKMQLQGAVSQSADGSSFVKRIRARIGQMSDLSGVTFSGGLSLENVDSLVQNLPDKKAKRLRKKLQSHINLPASHGLPQRSSAIPGIYTKKKAEKWIAKYKKSMDKTRRRAGNRCRRCTG